MYPKFLSLLPAIRVPLRGGTHPRRPRGSQLGWEKKQDESFQAQTKEPLGTNCHQTISKNSGRCRLLIGHKKCFVLLCPIDRFHSRDQYLDYRGYATILVYLNGKQTGSVLHVEHGFVHDRWLWQQKWTR